MTGRKIEGACGHFEAHAALFLSARNGHYAAASILEAAGARTFNVRIVSRETLPGLHLAAGALLLRDA